MFGSVRRTWRELRAYATTPPPEFVRSVWLIVALLLLCALGAVFGCSGRAPLPDTPLMRAPWLPDTLPAAHTVAREQLPAR